jgi:lipoprotein NlpD
MPLSGCVAPGSPVVTDRSVTKAKGGSYVVKKGDTLYSIAWRFDLDHQRLAAANNIDSPFTIYPGQRLRLSEQRPVKTASTGVTKTAGSARNTQQTRQSKPQTQPQKKPQAKPRTQSQTAPARTVAKTSVPKSRASGSPQSSQRADATWYRPISKKPDVPFGSNNKGLDYAIGSRAGVRAARSGKVVYAGNGIAGFERLIIVQHSSDLLSAYSFNGKMLVKEQQRVRGGAEIAQILPRPGVGQTLHFELRRKGKPINPQTLIP